MKKRRTKISIETWQKKTKKKKNKKKDRWVSPLKKKPKEEQERKIKSEPLRKSHQKGKTDR